MGRKLRRVPPGWKHPRDDDGRYLAMEDYTFDEAMDDWLAEYERWKVDQEEPTKAQFCEWWGDPTKSIYCRPAFDAEPTAYQVYQNVSEGTPVSPVFETVEELRRWLLAQGHSKVAVDRFIEGGYAPSLMMGPKGIRMGIDALDY